MLLETILFLTLKIKQNKFTKSVDRCEFGDLKNIYFLFLGEGGAKETFGRCPAPPPKIGLDAPLVGSETGVCDCVIGRRECSAAGTVNETDDMLLKV